MAFGDETAASFFREDRARQAGARHVAPAPALSSIFGGRPLTVSVPLNSPTAKPARTAKQVATAKNKKNADKNHDKPHAATHEAAVSSGSRSVCVRLCDGYHFPIGNAPAAGEAAAHEAVCSATCPGSPTRLYVLPAGTDDISKAYSLREGRSYSSLPVALRHADKHDNTCSCRRNNESQMSLVSLYRDFTLRSGDAIMTQKGFQIFRGASQWPYKPRDFANLSASKLAPAERRLLQRIEKVSINPNSSPREQPKTPPRTTATPVPMLGPFKVDRAALIAPAVSALPGRTAQAPTTAFP